MTFIRCTISGVVDPELLTPQASFGAGAGSRQVVETEGNYIDEEVVWQDAVYELAADIADHDHRVVDLGTGSGIKMLRHFGLDHQEIIQVDHRDGRMERDWSGTTFLTADFASAASLDRLEDQLRSPDPTLYVLADVIEHLRDPRPLLRILRRLLRGHSKNRLVISTPDRERIDGRNKSGVPDNPRHARQWTLNEFGLMLRSSGFEVEAVGRLPQNTADNWQRGVAAVVRCDDASYERFLARHGLPPRSDHVIITSEHGKLSRSGGIGSYCQDVVAVAEVAPIFLFCGSHGLEDDVIGACDRRGWIHVDRFSGSARPGVLDPDAVLAAVEHIVFLYDDVRLVEYQDYLGIGARVAQAKRAGLLPDRVTTVCYAHGNHFYLDRAADHIGVGRDLEIDAAERIALQESDVVLFPSQYLERLYCDDYGLSLRAVRRVPYPAVLGDRVREEGEYEAKDTVLFYGRASAQKGYPDFLEALRFVLSNPQASGAVTNVVILGVDEVPDWLTALPDIKVVHGAMSRAGARTALDRWAGRAVAVLPYRGDNQPLAVWEIISSGARLLTYDVGGVPEQLPEALWPELLCPPNPTSLGQRLLGVLSESHWDTLSIARNTWSLTWQTLEKARDEYRRTMAELKSLPVSQSGQVRSSVTAIVTNFNGQREWLDDVLFGLRNSLYQPDEVVFVDDASQPAAREVLSDALKSEAPPLRCRVLQLEENVGLAAARTAAAQDVSSDYVLVQDNDNVIRNEFVGLAIDMMNNDPSLAAVTSWTDYFEDGVDWQVEGGWRSGYRPLGADLGLGLLGNTIGDANAVYRTDALREVGFWDCSSRAKWEDWQLFVKLIVAGHKVSVIPREMLLYRVRPGSMLRQYEDFGGWQRIWRTLPIPANQQYGVMRSLLVGTQAVAPAPQAAPEPQLTESTTVDVDQLRADLLDAEQKLQGVLRSRTWRSTEGLRRFKRRVRGT